MLINSGHILVTLNVTKNQMFLFFVIVKKKKKTKKKTKKYDQ